MNLAVGSKMNCFVKETTADLSHLTSHKVRAVSHVMVVVSNQMLDKERRAQGSLSTAVSEMRDSKNIGETQSRGL